MADKAAAAGGMQRNLRLLMYVAGIYVCYLYYGVLQQSLYTPDPKDGTTFGYTAFVLFVQCLVNGGIALLGCVVSSALKLEEQGAYVDPKTHAATVLPFSSILTRQDVLVVAAVYVFAMYTSNEALQYVSYPAQALAKSCKMVPVMIGSVVLRGKRYNRWKYFAVALVTAGVTAYQFAGEAKSKGHGGRVSNAEKTLAEQAPGLLLLLLSLVLDGVSGPGQERLERYKMTNMQQVLASNVWAALYMFLVAAGMGQIGDALSYMSSHEGVLSKLLLFALSSAFGQIFIFACIRGFDSLVLSTVTTTRKFFTIVLSVIAFPKEKPPTALQWVCVFVVFAGLGIDAVYGKSGHKHGHGKHSSHEEHQHHHHHHHHHHGGKADDKRSPLQDGGSSESHVGVTDSFVPQASPEHPTATLRVAAASSS